MTIRGTNLQETRLRVEELESRLEVVDAKLSACLRLLASRLLRHDELAALNPMVGQSSSGNGTGGGAGGGGVGEGGTGGWAGWASPHVGSELADADEDEAQPDLDAEYADLDLRPDAGECSTHVPHHTLVICRSMECRLACQE